MNQTNSHRFALLDELLFCVLGSIVYIASQANLAHLEMLSSMSQVMMILFDAKVVSTAHKLKKVANKMCWGAQIC